MTAAVCRKLPAEVRENLFQCLAALSSDKAGDAEQYVCTLISAGILTEREGREILLDALIVSTIAMRFRCG